ncbi:Lipoyl synthase [Nymphon striatum]|nr:Lipoyl synthase [Nymphon striatum]
MSVKKAEQGVKLRGAEKVARIPIKVVPSTEIKRKPSWIRAKAPTTPEVKRLKQVLREQKLNTVCEEAACPNLGECFTKGTATFMIMGDICTRRCPFCDVGVPTKSGLMLGLGEEIEEVKEVMQDLRDHDCEMLTLGQYLQPSLDHLPVTRFVTPDEFKELEVIGYEMGFSHVASGPMVRSSYFADEQAADSSQSSFLRFIVAILLIRFIRIPSFNDFDVIVEIVTCT